MNAFLHKIGWQTWLFDLILDDYVVSASDQDGYKSLVGEMVLKVLVTLAVQGINEAHDGWMLWADTLASLHAVSNQIKDFGTLQFLNSLLAKTERILKQQFEVKKDLEVTVQNLTFMVSVTLGFLMCYLQEKKLVTSKEISNVINANQ